MDSTVVAEHALFEVGAWLEKTGYRFVTTTPATHARVQRRRGRLSAKSLRDIFGWSMPFQPSMLPPPVLGWLEQSDALEHTAGQLRSKVRYSTLDNGLYVHSAYPTTNANAVFFGPDTYRFASLIKQVLAVSASARPAHIVDLGCGSGAGAIVAAKTQRNAATHCTFTDINPAALEMARVNAALARVRGASFRGGSLFDPVSEPIDVLLANPPYLLDPQARLYRHGGGELGTELSTRIVVEGLPLLTPDGTLILYTGSPIVDGIDTFWNSVESVLREAGFGYEYWELDPDVFGEELDQPAYSQVERIAVVALVIRKSQSMVSGGAQRHIAEDSGRSGLQKRR